MELNLLSLRRSPLFTNLAEPPVEIQAHALPWKRYQVALQSCMNSLAIKRDWMADALGRLPVPRGKVKDPARWGPATSLSHASLSAWLRAREEMPTYRMTAALAICEMLAIYYQKQLEQSDVPDEFAGRRLEQAHAAAKPLLDEPTFQPWLKVYRRGLHRFLRHNQLSSPTDGALYAAYDEAMARKLAGYDLEEAK